MHLFWEQPATVLYGRSLPTEFFEKKDGDLDKLSLLIVAGTSLTVQPGIETSHVPPHPSLPPSLTKTEKSSVDGLR
jgi:NAD-dependent SIR2 family protein deacetylase